MVRNVTLTIDRKSVTVPENTTILEAARSVNINIPTLCYLKDINEIGACRICCVEVEGMERLVPACDNVVADGMVVFTNSAKEREARRMSGYYYGKQIVDEFMLALSKDTVDALGAADALIAAETDTRKRAVFMDLKALLLSKVVDE